MSPARACFLLAAFAVAALSVVALRASQTRCASELLALEAQRIEARREQWALQTRLARLRTPLHLHDRLEFIQADLIPPVTDDGPTRPDFVRKAQLTSHAEH